MWRAALVVLALAGVAAGGLAWRTAHPPLAGALRASLARALHRDDVAIAGARLVAPLGLQLDGVEVGTLSLGRAAAWVSPWAALRGRMQLDRLEVRGLSLADAIRAASLDVRRSGEGRARVTGRDVAIRSGGLAGVTIGELGVEITDRSLQRLAFASTRIGREGEPPLVDGLAGTATRDGDGAFSLRAARPGLVVTGFFAGGTLQARASVESLPLASLQPLAGRAGLHVEEARAVGTLAVVSSGRSGLRLAGKLDLDGVRLQHRTLAPRPIGPLAVTLDGALVAAPGRLALEQLTVASGPLRVILDGAVTRSGQLLAMAELKRARCAELLRAFPRDLLPALDGLVLDGELAGRAEVAGDLQRIGELGLDLKLDVGCRITGDPPLADVRALASPLGWRALDAAAPNWRPLPSLPTHLLRAFLASEDGRFFQHHGFDLDMIRRALAADVALGRIDRGASTLSQQLVKNLYLTGERTVARKIEETVLTWRLEQLVPKRRILEYYLNLVEFGPGVYGIADAAEKYFGKEPEGLTPDESAQLAALLPAPRRGMDAAWQKRYRSLMQRLPSETVIIPGTTPPPVKLSLLR